MKTFFLEASAKKQLEAIWDYTKETWGTKQAEKYTDGLLLQCEKLSMKKLSWQQYCIYQNDAIYRSNYKKHLVFFKETTNGKISILAIFHVSMDIPHHLVKYINDII